MNRSNFVGLIGAAMLVGTRGRGRVGVGSGSGRGRVRVGMDGGDRVAQNIGRL
jgi:hypothetical protein